MLTKPQRDNISAWADNKYRIIANKGGTRSGKTYSIIYVLVLMATDTRLKTRFIDVVSESLPHLKRGALNDIEDIMMSMGLCEGEQYNLNKSDNVYTFSSGSRIRFFSADDSGKVKGSRRDVLFVNECNRIPWETYRQLAVRTRETIFLDWNPDSEFWYEEHGLNTKDNTIELHSTYIDNPYLPEAQIAEIESNKDDENWWRVYGLGLTGMPQGLVYTNWDRVKRVPEGAELVGRGLDFGFTNDPTAIVDVYKQSGELFLDERCYRPGMTNDKIAEELRGLDGWTIADSAEMKSIMEIHNYGIRKVEPATKGADSIRAGIDILRRYKIHVTQQSLNVIFELRNYKYKEEKLTGILTNEPVDKFNHALDAVRYVALNLLNERPRSSRPRAKIGRI